MAVYFLGELETSNWDWYREYRKNSEPLVEKHGGRYLIKGGESERLEGTKELPSAFVLIEFPNAKSAKAFYNDPEYAPMIKLRQASGVQTEVCIIGGIEESA